MSELSVGTLSGLAANSYVIDVASGSQLTQPGMILQVVSVTLLDTFSASLATGGEADVTGLAATITPSSTSSKIMCLVSISLDSPAAGNANFAWIERNGTAIGIGNGEGSRKRVGASLQSDTNYPSSGPITFLDSPASTSALTYQVTIGHGSSATRIVYVNRSATNPNSVTSPRTISSITLMEVAG